MKKKYMKPTMDVEECSLSHFLLASKVDKMRVKTNNETKYDIYYDGEDEEGLDPD